MKRTLPALNNFFFAEEDLETFVKKRLLPQFSTLSLDENARTQLTNIKIIQSPFEPSTRKAQDIKRKSGTKTSVYKCTKYSKHKKNTEVAIPCPYTIYDLLRVDCFMKKFIDKSLEAMYEQTVEIQPYGMKMITNLAIESKANNVLAIEDEPSE